MTKTTVLDPLYALSPETCRAVIDGITDPLKRERFIDALDHYFGGSLSHTTGSHGKWTQILLTYVTLDSPKLSDEAHQLRWSQMPERAVVLFSDARFAVSDAGLLARRGAGV